MTWSRNRTLFLVFLCVLLADLTILSPISQGYPYLPFRVALSMILIAFLPGFCIVMSLYPNGGLESIEILGYSIMVSLLVSPLMAFAMSFLPCGFGTMDNPVPLLATLSAMTIIFAITAFFRCRRRP